MANAKFNNMKMLQTKKKIITITISFFILLIILQKQINFKKEFDASKLPECSLKYDNIIWDIKFKNAQTEQLDLVGIVGDTQGIHFDNKNNTIITSNGSNHKSINIYDYKNKLKIADFSYDISAGGLFVLESTNDDNYILTTDYNNSKLLKLDNNLSLIESYSLPKNINHIVGLTGVDKNNIFIPSRSDNEIIVINLEKKNDIRVFETNINNDYVTYDIDFYDGCFFLNYREMGKILLGYFDKNNFITKDIGIDLKYPQGMWVKNDNLFIVETGMHSLIRYDLKNYTKTISILPKGVFRSVTGIDENQLFISGQVF